MFGGGEMKFLKQLADRLSALYPYWDARIMDFNGLRVVAVDVFPDLSVSLYAIKSNQWLATSLMLARGVAGTRGRTAISTVLFRRLSGPS